MKRLMLFAFIYGATTVLAAADAPQAVPARGRVQTPPPTHPPLQAVEVNQLPEGVDQFDLFLLMGQSNMKGRGFMPEQPKRDPRIVMMHLRDDQWYLARHPLHLVGDAQTFQRADNAGVGPGLAFAETVAAAYPRARIGLIPCAVGGSSIARWQRGAALYDQAVRRAKLALQITAGAQGRLRGVLWLQGEADARDPQLAIHQERLLQLIDDLRADLELPDLPFIACTIGEMRPDTEGQNKAAMNQILLSLPKHRPGTACVDARDLKTDIGDGVHFDTAAQEEIGRRYAAHWFRLTRQP